MFIRPELGGKGTGCLFQFTYCVLGWPNCATLSFVGNSYYKINEACTIKYAYLIYTSFLHSTAINPYSNPTSYYDTRSLCKHGKLKSAILGVTYFCQVSDVTLFPRKNSKLRPSIILILGFNNIQLSWNTKLGKKEVLQLFSLTSYFLHTERRHFSVHHGCRPFWGSEICSGAEFVEVLSQKTGKKHTQKNVIKMFSILRPQATKNRVPRFTGKTRITGKTTEIPERPKNNRGLFPVLILLTLFI